MSLIRKTTTIITIRTKTIIINVIPISHEKRYFFFSSSYIPHKPNLDYSRDIRYLYVCRRNGFASVKIWFGSFYEETNDKEAEPVSGSSFQSLFIIRCCCKLLSSSLSFSIKLCFGYICVHKLIYGVLAASWFYYTKDLRQCPL